MSNKSEKAVTEVLNLANQGLKSRIADLEMQVHGKQKIIDEMDKAGKLILRHLNNLRIYHPGTNNLDIHHPIWNAINEMEFWIFGPEDQDERSKNEQ